MLPGPRTSAGQRFLTGLPFGPSPDTSPMSFFLWRRARIRNHGKDGGNLVDALSAPLSGDTAFTIEVKASSGPVLTLERRMPTNINPVIYFGY